MNGDAPSPRYTILLPTDGSLQAIAATTRAMQLARDREARIIILGVHELGSLPGSERITEDSALMRTAGIDGIVYAKTLATDQGIPFETLFRNGVVVAEILSAAAEFGIDVIIVGSSKPKGLTGPYLNNAAEGVVKQAPCDVTVVKLTEDEMRLALQSAIEMGERMRTRKANHGIVDLLRAMKFKIKRDFSPLLILSFLLIIINPAFMTTGHCSRSATPAS
jgi:nucleotide-binding universal stress UspA family protein